MSYSYNNVMGCYGGNDHGFMKDRCPNHQGMIEIAPQDTKIMGQNHQLSSWKHMGESSSLLHKKQG